MGLKRLVKGKTFFMKNMEKLVIRRSHDHHG